MSTRIMRALRLIGSHGVTLALLGVVALVVIAGLNAEIEVADWMALPAAGLCLNLVAALVAQGTLRAQPMLFAFHAMLLLLVLLVAADRLTALRGHVEITEGTMFDPALAEVEAGHLHDSALDRVAFLQGPFEIRYLPGMKRRETVSLVRIPNGDGGWRQVTVGDDDPLVVGDYRFYTSFNKGFAPVITYTGPDGQSVAGAVHMPSYPLHDYDQGNEWTTPGGRQIKLWLSMPEPVYREDAAWTFRKPADPKLVVIEGETRQELRQGQVATLAGGAKLQFTTLRSWMGYTIAANSLAPWLMAAAIAACLSLAVHLWERFQPATGVGAGVRMEAGHAR